MQERFKCLTNEFGAVDEGDVLTVTDGIVTNAEGITLDVELDCVKDEKYFHKLTNDEVDEVEVEVYDEDIDECNKIKTIKEDKTETNKDSDDVAVGDYIVVPNVFRVAKSEEDAKILAEVLLETNNSVYIAQIKKCARSETRIFWD